MEEQALRFCLGSRSSTSESTLRRQRPQNGIVPAESVRVVVIMDNGDFHSHPIQVHHTIHHWGCQRGSHTCGRGEKKAEESNTGKASTREAGG